MSRGLCLAFTCVMCLDFTCVSWHIIHIYMLHTWNQDVGSVSWFHRPHILISSRCNTFHIKTQTPHHDFIKILKSWCGVCEIKTQTPHVKARHRPHILISCVMSRGLCLDFIKMWHMWNQDLEIKMFHQDLKA